MKEPEESLAISEGERRNASRTSTEAALAMVKEWKRKAFEFSLQSNDPLVPVLSKGVDSMNSIMKKSEYCNIERALLSLERERMHSTQFDVSGEPSLRSLMYGTMGIAQSAMLHLIEENKQLRNRLNRSSVEISTQTDKIQTSYSVLNKSEETSIQLSPIKPKSEVLEDRVIIAIENPEGLELFDDFNDEEAEVTEEPLIKKSRCESGKEEGNKIVLESSSHVMKRSDTDIECPECEFRSRAVHSWVYHLKAKHSMTPKEAGVAVRCECGSVSSSDRHSRLCKTPNCIAIYQNGEPVKRFQAAHNGLDFFYDLSDDEPGDPVVKKSRFEPGKEDGNMVVSESSRSQQRIRSDTDIECPECDFRSRMVRSWIYHLKAKHSLTPTQAGVSVRCECGNISASEFHSRSCITSNFIAIYQNGEPVKRFEAAPSALELLGDLSDEETEDPMMKKSGFKYGQKDGNCNAPNFAAIRKKCFSNALKVKCIYCETFPKSMSGYIVHLQRYHNTNPIAIGLYMKCECGQNFHSHGMHVREHAKKCPSLQFTIHEEENMIPSSPRCVLCEAQPATAFGYAAHLHWRHNSNLNKNGIFLRCSCGLTVQTLHDDPNHSSNCDDRKYTLQVLPVPQ